MSKLGQIINKQVHGLDRKGT